MLLMDGWKKGMPQTSRLYLQRDFYRIDLATLVNKYIRETEKNLEQIFSRAEELDLILLLDEGAGLLTHRIGVQSANDRYANLEINHTKAPSCRWPHVSTVDLVLACYRPTPRSNSR